MIFQAAYLIFATLMTVRAVYNWRRQEWLNLGRALEMVLWWLGAVFILRPVLAQDVADLFGIGRGVDAILYIAVIFAYKLVFNQMRAVRRLEREITLLSREAALRSAEGPDEPEDC